MYPGDEEKLAYARKVLQRKARDHARTPVQWTDKHNAGFCPPDVKPWMRVNDDYKTVNVDAQLEERSGDDLSVYQFWKRGLANRREHKNVFVYGDFELLDEESKTVFAYKRASKDEAFVVVLNFSGHDIEWTIPETAKVKSWVAGTYSGGQPDNKTTGSIKLKPWEGILGESYLCRKPY